jgi:hypothetical protein
MLEVEIEELIHPEYFWSYYELWVTKDEVDPEIFMEEFEKYKSSSIEEDEYYLLCLERYNKFMNN